MRVTAFLFLGPLLFANPCSAETVRLTIYDDGRSCPANCDAHVVFHASLNGTVFAHKTTHTSAPFSKCVANTVCRLCFTSDATQCITAMYRGGGPAPMTFDFTPAFYEAACAQDSPPPVLEQRCGELRRAAADLASRKNCIRDRDSRVCRSLMDAALAREHADRPLYDECIASGQTRFNASHPASARRSLGCAYEFLRTGGPNSHGTRWRKLLPGACRANTFVGRDGLDCCSGSPFADGPLGRECRIFYPP